MSKKTTAKVEHRDYIPWGWIAIPFCDVEFYGFRAKEMEEKWSDIQRKRYEKYHSIVEQNEKEIKDLKDSASSIRKQAENSKPFYRFWYTKKEKELLAKAENLYLQAYRLEKSNEKLEDKEEFGVHKCHKKIKKLLEQNGFVLTHINSKGKECVTETEIWTLEED